MPALNTAAAFSLTALTLLLIPGQVVMFVSARSIEKGRKAGIISALGVAAGDLCHVLIAALGLGTVLAAAPTALAGIQYAGAAFLLYLGLRTLFQKEERTKTEGGISTRGRRAFTQGFFVSLLNANTVLFFVSFLPQFLDPSSGGVAGQIMILGTLFVLIGICTNILYIFLASAASNLLSENSGFLWARKYLSGVVFLALGLATALRA